MKTVTKLYITKGWKIEMLRIIKGCLLWFGKGNKIHFLLLNKNHWKGMIIQGTPFWVHIENDKTKHFDRNIRFEI